MCLAIPGKVVKKLDSDTILVDFGGVRKEVKTTLLTEELEIGKDYVLVHIGYAMAVVDEEDALETLRLLAEIDEVATQQAQS
ncbi:MAG: HypC/HybG/HupF family hydrogenase formation chaperone [Candidatus Heimdallarchaeota archaeon]|nr:HypC/HybG/HupF family hydrogenase formation chaperone [Candidatus Heimdallarchaeota archaeon]